MLVAVKQYQALLAASFKKLQKAAPHLHFKFKTHIIHICTRGRLFPPPPGFPGSCESLFKVSTLTFQGLCGRMRSSQQETGAGNPAFSLLI